jgi:hypothetical protein
MSGFTLGGEVPAGLALADKGAVAGTDEGDALVERLARTEGAADLVDSRVEGGFGLHAWKSVSDYGGRIERVQEKQMTPIWACLSHRSAQAPPRDGRGFRSMQTGLIFFFAR